MQEDNHFVTTNMMNYQNFRYGGKNKGNYNQKLNKSVLITHPKEKELERNRSQVPTRSKSPMVSRSRKQQKEQIAAGATRMNSTLYSQPTQHGIKNTRFRHPNLASNVVFYETSPNMRQPETDAFVSTSNLMHSLSASKFAVGQQFKRTFVANGNVTERLTRRNTSNLKNKSSFDLSHSRPATSKSPMYRASKYTPQIQEIEAAGPAVNVWRYKDSPYKKKFTQEGHKTARKEDKNAFRKARENHEAAQNYATIQQEVKNGLSGRKHSLPAGKLHYNNWTTKPQEESWRNEDLVPQEQKPISKGKEIKNSSAKVNKPTIAEDVGPQSPQPVQEPEYPTYTLDLQDVQPLGRTARQEKVEDDAVSGYSNAFERHLERQEQEKYKRYITNLRKERFLANLEMPDNDMKKDILSGYDPDVNNGASLVLSGDPRIKLYQKRRDEREKITSA